MLEASRQELEETIPNDANLLLRLLKKVEWGFDTYIYEPLATGLRFLHLVVIFVPVILTTPMMLIGSRNRGRDNERSGTLWWYSFLVYAMELAGPAFIKVGSLAIFDGLWLTVHSLDNGLPHVKTSFLLRCVMSCPNFILTLRRTP